VGARRGGGDGESLGRREERFKTRKEEKWGHFKKSKSSGSLGGRGKNKGDERKVVFPQRKRV